MNLILLEINIANMTQASGPSSAGTSDLPTAAYYSSTSYYSPKARTLPTPAQENKTLIVRPQQPLLSKPELERQLLFQRNYVQFWEPTICLKGI